MKCPYCDNEMKRGKITGDGRTRVRFKADGEPYGWSEFFSGKGHVKVNYGFGSFSVDANYCEKCKKMIIDTVVS